MMNLKPTETRYFYEVKNTIYYITDNDNDNIQQETKISKGNNKTASYFMLNKKYVSKDEYGNNMYDIIGFQKDFNEFNNELNDIGYKNYFNDKSASLCFLHRMSYKYKGSRTNWYENICQHQSIKEFYCIENCFNGGLTYFNAEFKEKQIECHSYDFSSEYGQILGNSDFKFPVTQGKYNICNEELFEKTENKYSQNKYYKLREEYKELPYGLYKVNVIIKDHKFCNIFEFSLENWYNSYVLNYLLQVKNKYSVELNFTGECLIYDDKTEFIDKNYFNCKNPHFGKGWYDYLQNDLKKKYPKNFLVKNLISKIWGGMSQRLRHFFNEDEFFDLDCRDITDDKPSEYKLIDIHINKDGSQYYECIKSSQPTKYKYSRIKPFITGYSRVIMYKLLEFIDLDKYFNNIVRINTDGITFDCPIPNINEFKSVVDAPLKEDKTSGLIVWSSTNTWKKIG